MSKNKKILTFVLVAALVLFFAVYSFTPVLLVESKRIGYSKFLKIRGALEKFNSLSNIKLNEDLNTIALMNLVEQEFLDILINNVDHNLEIEADKIVEEAVLKTEGLSLKKASEELYGLSSEDFKKLVLLPQAKRDLLDKHFKEKKEDILQAWASLYGTASIKVYYPGYYWDKEIYSIKKK